MVSKVKFIVESYMVFDVVSCFGGYEIPLLVQMPLIRNEAARRNGK